MNSKILIIIPAFNEEESILKVYDTIQKYNDCHDLQYDVIVINDGSTDNTKTICVNNNIPFVSLVHNLGIGGAVQTGYKYAFENNYDIAIQFDGDGQHDIEYVVKIINPILENRADFVIGSRFIDKSESEFQTSFARRVGIKVISTVIKMITRKKVLDTTSGFRAVNKPIIEEFALRYPTEYPESITTAELIKKGYSYEEVPVQMFEREGGVSSIKAWKNFYFMINVVLTLLIVGVRRHSNVK